MKKIILLLSVVLCFSAIAFAQPRPVDKPTVTNTSKKMAPQSVQAKYEGGMFGYSEKEEGMLKFDDDSSRLIFYGEDKKEKFAIPYKSILIVYPSEKKVQSGTGRAIGVVPVFGAGIGGSLLKKKKHYLAIQFDDPDVDAKGTTNFLIDTDDLLDSIIYTIGEKAKLSQRGDAYYRPRSGI
jgi:hypothetical protein